MRFRPCIDIHNGAVKQIVGSTLSDKDDSAVENFIAKKRAEWYADLFRRDGLTGGHVILLNAVTSPYYEKTRAEALRALAAFPGGFGVGGGIRPETAEAFLSAGAGWVIVTSYVIEEGRFSFSRLEKMKAAVGRDHLILDLSAMGDEDGYHVMTDRWQTKTDVLLDEALLKEIAPCCAEILVHGVGVEGKRGGVDEALIAHLARICPLPVTYAGGVGSLSDLGNVRRAGGGKIDVTVGSALDLYGGSLRYEDVLASCNASVRTV